MGRRPPKPKNCKSTWCSQRRSWREIGTQCIAPCKFSPYCVRTFQLNTGELLDKHIEIIEGELFCNICGTQIMPDPWWRIVGPRTVRIYDMSGDLYEKGISYPTHCFHWERYMGATMMHLINAHHLIPNDFPVPGFPWGNRVKALNNYLRRSHGYKKPSKTKLEDIWIGRMEQWKNRGAA